MDNTIHALLLSTLAGFSTMIGTVIIFISPKKNERLLSIALGLAGGVMISVSFMELLPEALNHFSNIYNQYISTILMVITLIFGVVFASLLDKFIPHNEENDTHEMKHENLYRVGIVSMLAIAIAFHNIPEGLTVALPMYISTGSKKKALITTFISSLAEPIGALLAFLVLRPYINDLSLGIIFGMISGIMLYIALEELLPSSRDYGYPRLALYSAFAGICLMPLTLMF